MKHSKKIAFFVIAILFLLLDVAISGKYSPSNTVLLFPILFFMLLGKFSDKDLLVPGLLYGFLFDISSLSPFPKMIFIITGIYFLGRFLRGKLIDISQPVNLYIFSITISLVVFLVANIGFISLTPPLLIVFAAVRNIIYSSVAFVIFYFCTEKLVKTRLVDEER